MTEKWRERARRVAVISAGAVFAALVLVVAWWIQRPLSDPPEAARVDAVVPEPAGPSSVALEY